MWSRSVLALCAAASSVTAPVIATAIEVRVVMSHHSPGSGWTWIIDDTSNIWRVHHTDPDDSALVGTFGAVDPAIALRNESPGYGWAWVLTRAGDVWAVHMDTPSDSYLVGNCGVSDVRTAIDHESPGSGWAWILNDRGDVWAVHMDTPADSYLIGNVFGTAPVALDAESWARMKAAFR